jgi:hypothetical protein
MFIVCNASMGLGDTGQGVIRKKREMMKGRKVRVGMPSFGIQGRRSFRTTPQRAECKLLTRCGRRQQPTKVPGEKKNTMKKSKFCLCKNISVNERRTHQFGDCDHWSLGTQYRRH